MHLRTFSLCNVGGERREMSMPITGVHIHIRAPVKRRDNFVTRHVHTLIKTF